jgi:transformation/transcription domain-associated protein
MRSQAVAARAQQARAATPTTVSVMRGGVAADGDVVMGNSQSESIKQDGSTTVDGMIAGMNGNRVETPQAAHNNGVGGVPSISTPRQPWEYVEEIVAILKTAFPLLALTLETIQDQLKQRFKPSNEEDNYRILSNAVAAGLNVCCTWSSLLTDLTLHRIFITDSLSPRTI